MNNLEFITLIHNGTLPTDKLLLFNNFIRNYTGKYLQIKVGHVTGRTQKQRGYWFGYVAGCYRNLMFREGYDWSAALAYEKLKMQFNPVPRLNKAGKYLGGEEGGSIEDLTQAEQQRILDKIAQFMSEWFDFELKPPCEDWRFSPEHQLPERF